VLPTITVLKSGINYVFVIYRDVLAYFCNKLFGSKKKKKKKKEKKVISG